MAGNFLDNLVSLFYPDVCAACGTLLYKGEDTVCLSCRILLPKTGYENDDHNPIARMFWGRIPFHAVSSCYFFSKQGKIQHLIHELKYKQNKEAGIFLGKELAKTLADSKYFSDIDFIVPVPLHPKKMHKRGYNQSEIIGKGMLENIHAQLSTTNLVRSFASATQTHKSRLARWDNVKDIFVLNRPEEFAGRHILLIDDVITTGSTIEACGRALMQAPEIKISVAAAACAVS